MFWVRGKGYCQTAVSAWKRPRAKTITTVWGEVTHFVSKHKAREQPETRQARLNRQHEHKRRAMKQPKARQPRLERHGLCIDGRLLIWSTNLIWTVMMVVKVASGKGHAFIKTILINTRNLPHDFSVKLSLCMCSPGCSLHPLHVNIDCIHTFEWL